MVIGNFTAGTTGECVGGTTMGKSAWNACEAGLVSGVSVSGSFTQMVSAGRSNEKGAAPVR